MTRKSCGSVNGALWHSLKECGRSCCGVIDNHAFPVFLADKLPIIVAEYGVYEDAHERLTALVERAHKTPRLLPEKRTDANRVHGCVSVVWLVGDVQSGRVYFHGDAESPVVRGLVVFLCDFFSGAPIAEVATSDLEPLEALELTRNLSPTRRNGLAAARRAIRGFAQTAQRSTSA